MRVAPAQRLLSPREHKMEEAVLSELNLDLKSLKVGVQQIMDWTSKLDHLPNIKDENLLMSFIIGSKSIERAKSRLDSYFRNRNKYPNIFKNRDLNTIQMHRIPPFVCLPKQTKEYHNIFLCQAPRGQMAKDFSFEETARYWFMFLDHFLRHRVFSAGQIVLIDCKDITVELALKYYPSIAAAVIDSVQNAYPMRLKLMVWFNSPATAVTLVNIVKAILSEKLKKRFYVHSEDHTILEKYIQKSLLPKEYGGEMTSYENLCEELKESLMKERDWFINEGSLSSDETKRPNNTNQLQELNGTFRKLEVD